MPEAKTIRSMFGRIAPRYDLLNRVLSCGTDRRWRSVVVREAGPLRDRVVVDSATGTGDLALAFAAEGARVIGTDFTHEMLVLAQEKRKGETSFVGGDALALPLPDDMADLGTIAFGIRNVADRIRGMAELARVVQPGGRIFVLEFSMPKGRLMGPLYRFYFTRVLPIVGGWISGDRAAYSYLPSSVLEWPSPDELQAEMESIGLVDCGYRLLTRGVACLSYGRVPEA